MDPVAPPTREAVQRRIAALAARRGAAGVQYVVYRQGRPWLEHAEGLADVAQRRPVDRRTTFNAYSLAKPLTAATVLVLADAGRLDLDARIGTAADVDGLQAYGTVRETLLHRGGFRNPNPLRWIHPAEAHDHFDEAGFVQARVAALRGTRRRLARSGYSNLGYLLLGLAIERAAQAPYPQAVRSAVVDAIRPGDDEALAWRIDHPDHHAPGHLRRRGLLDLSMGCFVDRAAVVQHTGDRWVQLRLHQVDGSAYGGLIANARGLARFAQAMLAEDGGLSLAVRRRMLEIAPGPGPLRSLGWFAGDVAGQRWFGHAGGGLGGYGELRVYPALGAASALLTNGPGLVDARCLDSIDTAWLPP